MNWKTVKLIGNDISDEWRAAYSRGKLFIGKVAVDALIEKWQVMRPLVVSMPGSREYLPVLEVQEYRDKAFERAKRSQRLMLLITAFYLLLAIIYWYIKGGEKSITIIFVIFLFALYFILDYQLVVRHFERLKERASFIVFVYLYGKKYALEWAGFAVVIGCIQYVMQWHYGGFESMMYTWGLVYESVNKGEWWRFVTGPFFHSGLSHWILNTATLILFAPVVGVISRLDGIIVFVLGNIGGFVAAWLQNITGFSESDAIVGISGGISAMIGWLVAVSVVYKKDLPQMFAFSLLGFFLLWQLLAILMYPKASIVAHLGGFCVGLAWVVLFRRKSFFPRNSHDTETSLQ